MCTRFLSLLLVSVSVACATPARGGAPARVLRVCADPNNLPFSNNRFEGFENRIAEIVAGALHARLDYVWWAQRRGFVRNTLGAGVCDIVMGVPNHFARTRTTKPYYRSTYVFVTRAGEPAPRSFDDPLLTRALVGVQLIGDDFANSPPAHALTARHIVDNVRGYTVYGDYREPNPPARIVDAVAAREIDVAVAWGPLAGYVARHSTVPLMLTPVAPEIDPPAMPFVFEISIGVASANQPLVDELNAVIDSERPAIDEVLDSFGVPRVNHPAGGR